MPERAKFFHRHAFAIMPSPLEKESPDSPSHELAVHVASSGMDGAKALRECESLRAPVAPAVSANSRPVVRATGRRRTARPLL